MDSPQSVTSAVKSSPTLSEPVKQNTDFLMPTSGYLLRRAEVSREETMSSTVENFIGVLEVYIYQARDVHNICIYHKQDVYGKFFLTNNPESTVSTQIINGGGRNPVFNETLRLNVGVIDASLKCEIWMLSRVRNYLEDQLLGFALVPLSEVLISNGKLEKEFSLSSTDLFYSPAGFVHLSLSYSGASPEVMNISAPPSSVSTNGTKKDLDSPESVESDLDKIQFPDPQVVNEHQMMVSEYFGIPYSTMDSDICEKLSTPETETNINREMGARVVESFSKAPVCDVQVPPKKSSPPSSVSNYDSPSMSLPSSFDSCETPKVLTSLDHEQISQLKDSSGEAEDGDSNSSGAAAIDPVPSANIDVEQKVVQQEIVDMYMKSMQQFTESLARMKLPMDIEQTPTSAGNSLSADQKSQGSKTNGSRVFYGSRAFF